jgi:hypothetical protein
MDSRAIGKDVNGERQDLKEIMLKIAGEVLGLPFKRKYSEAVTIRYNEIASTNDDTKKSYLKHLNTDAIEDKIEQKRKSTIAKRRKK